MDLVTLRSSGNRSKNVRCILRLLVVPALLLASAGTARAELLAFSFAGQVTTLNSTATRYFSLPIAVGNSISGRFVLDTLKLPHATSTSSNANYLQQYVDGLVLNIGPNTVKATDYTIAISDQSSGSDALTVRFSTFSSSVYPTNPPPLKVNGVDRSAGRMSFTFSAPSTLLSSTEIPFASIFPSFGTSILGDSLGFLSNSNTFLGAQFTLSPLTQVAAPEPSAFAAAASGLAFFVFAVLNARRRRHKV